MHLYKYNASNKINALNIAKAPRASQSVQELA